MFGSHPQRFTILFPGVQVGEFWSFLGDSDTQLELQAITLGSCYSRCADVPSASPGSLLDIQNQSPPHTCWTWICILMKLPGKL